MNGSRVEGILQLPYIAEENADEDPELQVALLCLYSLPCTILFIGIYTYRCFHLYLRDLKPKRSQPVYLHMELHLDTQGQNQNGKTPPSSVRVCQLSLMRLQVSVSSEGTTSRQVKEAILAHGRQAQCFHCCSSVLPLPTLNWKLLFLPHSCAAIPERLVAVRQVGLQWLLCCAPKEGLHIQTGCTACL